MPAGPNPMPQPRLLASSYAEQLLVWALRRIVVRHTVCPVVAREFADACGADAGEMAWPDRRRTAAPRPDRGGARRRSAAVRGQSMLDQELKQELGLGDYEGRGWRGFHHHATLCIADFGFLIAERDAFPPQGLGAATAVSRELLRHSGVVCVGGRAC